MNGKTRDCLNLGSYNYLGFADDWHDTCKVRPQIYIYHIIYLHLHVCISSIYIYTSERGAHTGMLM